MFICFIICFTFILPGRSFENQFSFTMMTTVILFFFFFLSLSCWGGLPQALHPGHGLAQAVLPHGRVQAPERVSLPSAHISI